MSKKETFIAEIEDILARGATLSEDAMTLLHLKVP